MRSVILDREQTLPLQVVLLFIAYMGFEFGAPVNGRPSVVDKMTPRVSPESAMRAAVREGLGVEIRAGDLPASFWRVDRALADMERHEQAAALAHAFVAAFDVAHAAAARGDEE